MYRPILAFFVICGFLVTGYLCGQSVIGSRGVAGDDLDLPAQVRRASHEEYTTETVNFFGELFEGNAFVFIRGNQHGSRCSWFSPKQDIARGIDDLSPHTEFAVVFGTGTRSHSYPGRMKKPVNATRAHKRGAREFLTSLRSPSPVADIKPLLLQSLTLARRSDRSKKVMIYVGTAGNGDHGELHLTLLDVAAKNQGEVQIHTIGVDDDPVGERFLIDLARQNGGTYRRLDR